MLCDASLLCWPEPEKLTLTKKSVNRKTKQGKMKSIRFPYIHIAFLWLFQAKPIKPDPFWLQFSIEFSIPVTTLLDKLQRSPNLIKILERKTGKHVLIELPLLLNQTLHISDSAVTDWFYSQILQRRIDT